ncbi:hypothetical protein [Opitutus sp. GAS368]|uniref:hypothetical protein n=1 Tax=Opitutus sp. GAS368 TaxID=1882749 RepID=UPI00087BA533|nr:hypothetical protein [Opitutus sp. GAS368]SDS26079.1 hypothetical protein SAMN05444173_2356 [Opitutus sp. GAS368]
MMTAPRNTLPIRMWLLAGVLMLAEFLLFDRMASRDHASLYPRWNDQIQYLTESYYAYDHMQAHGLAAGLKFAWDTPAVQGKLHNTCAVLIFWVAGSASRSAALSLNLLVFLAWQAALLFTIPRVTGSRVLAWMGFGLVLCAARSWSGEAGSAVDFRLDHGAMCLFGVTSCVALLTDGFRSKGWSLALGVAVGATLLERFLAGAYFAPIFVLLVIWLLCTKDRWPRLLNLLLAGGVAAALALPVFWVNREGILGYYWVGHVTGAESAARLLGFDLGQSAKFVIGHLGDLYLGAWFGWTVAGLTGLLLLLLACHPRKPAAGFAPGIFFFGLVFLLVPAVILTLHQQKSEAVLGVLVPGVVLLVLWLWQVLWSRIEFCPDPAWRRWLPALPALAALSAGGSYFVLHELQPSYSPEFRQSAVRVSQISDYIYARVRAGNLAAPSVGVDQIVDFIDGRILRLVCYERHKVWIPFGVHLPDSILAGPDEAVFFKLQATDFMILTDQMPGHGHWPYDQQMWRLYPQLKAWCDGHLRLVETFSVFGRDMSLYQRKDLP